MAEYIEISRNFPEWEWYTDQNVTVIYIDLWLNTDKSNTVKTTLNRLSIETGLTIQNIRTALKKLKRTGYITTEKERNKTIIKLIENEYIR